MFNKTKAFFVSVVDGLLNYVLWYLYIILLITIGVDYLNLFNLSFVQVAGFVIITRQVVVLITYPTNLHTKNKKLTHDRIVEIINPSETEVYSANNITEYIFDSKMLHYNFNTHSCRIASIGDTRTFFHGKLYTDNQLKMILKFIKKPKG